MPMFKPINDNEANPKVKKIFDEIKTTRKITIKTCSKKLSFVFFFNEINTNKTRGKK